MTTNSWGRPEPKFRSPRKVEFFDGKQYREGEIEERNGTLAYIRDTETGEGSWRDRWEINSY